MGTEMARPGRRTIGELLGGWCRPLVDPRGTRRAYAVGGLSYIVLITSAFMLPLSWGLWPLVGVFVVVSCFVWRLAPPGWGTKVAHEISALVIGILVSPLVMILILFIQPLL